MMTTMVHPPAIGGAEFRRVLGHYPTGVCVITAMEPGVGPVGMVVGSFTSVSLDPPLVAFLPDRNSRRWSLIERSGRFRVNVLGAHQKELCRHFAGPRDENFVGLEYRLSAQGSPVLDGVVAWIECGLDAVHEAGDHFIVIGRVLDLGTTDIHVPLLFQRGAYGGFAPF